VSNRIDGRRIQPHCEGSGSPATETVGASARDLRALARDRLDAFAAGRTTGPPTGTDDIQCPDDDFDRCIDRTVPSPRLWIHQGADADAIDRADVQQHEIGDCYVMAVLAALTNSPEGRNFLRGAITENTDAAGRVLSYTVTLHQPQRRWFFPTTFTPLRVDVAPVYARGHAGARPGDGSNEVWVPVMERAYAQYAGGYNAMGHGGSIADAMEVVTGQPARRVALRPLFGRYGPDDLQRDLLAGRLVAIASRDDVEQTRPDLVPNHAYVVTGIEQQAGKPALRLWNPWGIVQPAPVPFDKMNSLFVQVDVGSVK